MTDAGFFRGTSTEQDVRFSDKDKKLLKMMKFEDCLEQKVDMHKVNFEALKPWVSEQVTKILGIEDEVVIELIFSFLENDRHPNAKKLQILVTGFLQSKPARIFIGQLWDLLLSAQGNPAKLPERFIEEKKNAIRQQKKKIEMELTMREDQKRFSPLRNSYYFGQYGGRSADPPRSPVRKIDRRNKTELSETGVDVLKSEASSTQADMEHTENKNIAQTADTQTENKFKSVEAESEQLEGRKGLEREREGRGEYRDRHRSRSRSYSPKGRRHRSRSHERERRHRYRSSPHRHQHSPVYSPDSHAHQQRGRGHHRESPRQSRPHRSLEERHYHERPVDPPKHKEHQDTSPHIQDTFTYPSDHYSSATKKHSATEVQTDSRRGHISSKRRKVTPPSSGHHQKQSLSRQPKYSHRNKQREESLSSSSRSPPPVEKRHTRGEDVRTREKECPSSSSVSSESESSPTPEKHRHTSSRPVTQSKPRVREPVRSRRDSSPRGSTRHSKKLSKHKHHHKDTLSPSESERSEHTSDNFSEVEARRKEAVRDKKLKHSLSVKKKQRERERERYPGGKAKVKVSSRRGHSDHRSAIGSKRKNSSRRVRSHDDSYDSEYMREGGRDRGKKRHTHISPVVVKKTRHRLPPPESNTESSDSEDTSSSDSDSEWSGERRTGDKKRRVESSEDSSESEDSTQRERGRSSLEKHLREKVIQAMSKKRLRKNKS